MRPHIEPFCDRDEGFKHLRLPNFASGMHYKMLSFDGDTGACSMTVQFDGGYRRTPGFAWTEMEMIIIEGEMQVGEKTCRKGHYLFVPAGYAMPEMTSPKGCLALVMYNTGEPSHEESTQHHPLAQVDLVALRPGTFLRNGVVAKIHTAVPHLRAEFLPVELQHEVPVFFLRLDEAVAGDDHDVTAVHLRFASAD